MIGGSAAWILLAVGAIQQTAGHGSGKNEYRGVGLVSSDGMQVRWCADTELTFCVSASLSETTPGAAVFVVASRESRGWVSLGSGDSMRGSDMVVGWHLNWTSEGDAGVMLSARHSRHHDLPDSVAGLPFFSAANNRIAPVVVDAATTIASKALVFAFETRASSGFYDPRAPSNFIFALSHSPVVSPYDQASPFAIHSMTGHLVLDLSVLRIPSSSTSTTKSIPLPPPFHPDNASFNSQVSFSAFSSTSLADTDSHRNSFDFILMHGIFMTLAWTLLPWTAIFIARYCKDLLGHTWYLSHKYIMLIGVGGAIVIGMIAIEQEADDDDHFTSHKILGLLLIAFLFPIQIALGFYANARFDEHRSHIPWWDKMHWYVGRVAVVLALINVHWGMQLYDAPYAAFVALWVIVAVVLVVVFCCVGEIRMGGVVHHGGDGLQLLESSEEPETGDAAIDSGATAFPMKKNPKSNGFKRLLEEE